MSVALASRSRLRFSGRSFLAFVIEPVRPVTDWLTDLDNVARQSFGFFANRPVILDLAGLAPDRAETVEIVDALKARAIRVVAVEGVDPAWLELSLAPLARGIDSAKIIDFPGAGDRREAEVEHVEAPAPPKAASKIIQRPVRSGQSIFYPDGDLTIIGAVSSGAEVVAGGSVHVYGALRGRALAGATGNGEARIFCRKFEAELVAIDGHYFTAEMSPPELLGKPVQIRLEGDTIELNVSD